jgi:hypothetical protein
MATRQSEGLSFLWEKQFLIYYLISDYLIIFKIASLIFSKNRPGNKIDRLQALIIIRRRKSHLKLLDLAYALHQ